LKWKNISCFPNTRYVESLNSKKKREKQLFKKK